MSNTASTSGAPPRSRPSTATSTPGRTPRRAPPPPAMWAARRAAARASSASSADHALARRQANRLHDAQVSDVGHRVGIVEHGEAGLRHLGCLERARITRPCRESGRPRRAGCVGNASSRTPPPRQRARPWSSTATTASMGARESGASIAAAAVGSSSGTITARSPMVADKMGISSEATTTSTSRARAAATKSAAR